CAMGSHRTPRDRSIRARVAQELQGVHGCGPHRARQGRARQNHVSDSGYRLRWTPVDGVACPAVQDECGKCENACLTAKTAYFSLSVRSRTGARGSTLPLPIHFPRGSHMKVAKLDSKTVERLKLPPGKLDEFYWDQSMPGFGIRLDARRGPLRRSYVAA